MQVKVQRPGSQHPPGTAGEDQTLRTLALVQALPGGAGMDPRRLGIVATRIARAFTMAAKDPSPNNIDIWAADPSPLAASQLRTV